MRPMGDVIRIRTEEPAGQLAIASATFLASGDFMETTRRKYESTLDKLIDDAGVNFDVAVITLHPHREPPAS